jgi:1-deoxy-D-xylulose-5-phosphate reductoisomerase
MGSAYCIYLNASNEIAVEAFLLGKIDFTQIPELIEKTLFKAEVVNIDSVEHILEIDNYSQNRN